MNVLVVLLAQKSVVATGPVVPPRPQLETTKQKEDERNNHTIQTVPTSIGITEVKRSPRTFTRSAPPPPERLQRPQILTTQLKQSIKCNSNIIRTTSSEDSVGTSDEVLSSATSAIPRRKSLAERFANARPDNRPLPDVSLGENYFSLIMKQI